MFSGLSAASHSARRWTAPASFMLQAVIIAGVMVFPMVYPQSLPPVFLDRRIFVPLSNGEVRAETSTHGSTSSGPTLPQALVVSRDGISFKSYAAEPGPDPDAPPSPIGSPRGLDVGFVSVSPTVPPPPPAASRSIRTSVVMEGNLIRRVDPQYPAIAKQIHLEGAVVLNAIVSREGNIERVDVASGPGILALAAREAVRQWKYRPYLLNGEPVEVQTQITVNFTLAH
jgi:protein TonB